jgi:hypothetical protein
MGQDPGAGGAQVSGTREPEQIRDDIAATREHFGDTVEALAAKTDVKAQARERLAEARRSAAARKDELLGKARQAAPESATAGASGLSRRARENPAPVAAVALFVAGFAAGRVSGRR